ncbi:MAG TPA: SDR family NAD(P)-dependent oxidoreductase [Ktedonobacteraceae bacterium]
MAQADMRGKICLVTGANSGIGKATATGLAKLGATVVMVCRNQARGEEALAEIRANSGSDAVALLLADLSSQASIHQLTHLLLDRLKASAPARIVNVTSALNGPLDFDDLQREKRFDPMQVYAQSKFALMNHLDVWYFHLDVEGILAMARGMAGRKELEKRVERASARASKRTRLETFPKLTEVVNGQFRIKDEPPLIFHYDPLDTDRDNLDTKEWRAMVKQ